MAHKLLYTSEDYTNFVCLGGCVNIRMSTRKSTL